MDTKNDSFGKLVGIYVLLLVVEYVLSLVYAFTFTILGLIVWVIVSAIAGIRAVKLIRDFGTAREKIVLGLIAYILLSSVVWNLVEISSRV